jgi:excisionase family DNA binding protein
MTRDTRTPTPLERLLVKPEEAATMLGIGRTRMYELLARGEIPSRRLGRSRLIDPEDVRAYAARLPD